MKKFFKIVIIVFSFILFSCSEDKVDDVVFGTVSGKVVEAVTFEPIANVKVFSSPNSSIVFTDENGNFSIVNVPIGDYSFQAKKDGYITKFEGITVTAGANTEIVFELDLSTSDNNPPSTPVLVAPTDQSINQNIQVPLNWTSSDIEEDELTYEVILKNDFNNDEIIFENITSNSYTLSNLMYGVKILLASNSFRWNKRKSVQSYLGFYNY